MQALWRLFRLILPFRAPASLPAEITEALGVELSRGLSFHECMDYLSSTTCEPTRLLKFMPRQDAESAFETAQRKELFKHTSLYSYYLNEGWLEFSLHFDDLSRLRRIYIHHKAIPEENGLEIRLTKAIHTQTKVD